MWDARITARNAEFKQFELARAQTACSNNSYIKPKTLLNFSVDYETFERFQKIKNLLKNPASERFFICQEVQLHNWIP